MFWGFSAQSSWCSLLKTLKLATRSDTASYHVVGISNTRFRMYACLGVFWILVHAARFCSNSLQHKLFHQQSTLQKMEPLFSFTKFRNIDNEHFNPLWRYCPALHWTAGHRITQSALAITHRQAILQVELLQILKCKKCNASTDETCAEWYSYQNI